MLMAMLPFLIPLLYFIVRWRAAGLVVLALLPRLALFLVGHLLISMALEFRTYTVLALVTWPGLLSSLSRGGRLIRVRESAEVH